MKDVMSSSYIDSFDIRVHALPLTMRRLVIIGMVVSAIVVVAGDRLGDERLLRREGEREDRVECQGDEELHAIVTVSI